VAPDAFICANIGGQQLLEITPTLLQKRIIDPVRADALIIHLNVLQEMMQPEGDITFKGIANAISNVVKSIEIPIIVKETGAGISGKVAQKLFDVGVRVIDVAGSGGTSWAKVENQRERTVQPRPIFNEWGIPTVDCLLEIEKLKLDGLTLISSGGIRSSLDILKSIALGATTTAMAQPIIKVLYESGSDGLHSYLETIRKEIQIGMLLLGTQSVSEISHEHIYIQ
jgi:isopentenyl-diphosphate Delta-isomerase